MEEVDVGEIRGGFNFLGKFGAANGVGGNVNEFVQLEPAPRGALLHDLQGDIKAFGVKIGGIERGGELDIQTRKGFMQGRPAGNEPTNGESWIGADGDFIAPGTRFKALGGMGYFLQRGGDFR